MPQLEWLIILPPHVRWEKGNADEIRTLDYLESLTKKEKSFGCEITFASYGFLASTILTL